MSQLEWVITTLKDFLHFNSFPCVLNFLVIEHEAYDFKWFDIVDYL